MTSTCSIARSAEKTAGEASDGTMDGRDVVCITAAMHAKSRAADMTMAWAGKRVLLSGFTPLEHQKTRSKPPRPKRPRHPSPKYRRLITFLHPKGASPL